MRADKYFAEKFGSRTKAAEAIEKGLILVNGKVIKTKTEILPTDQIAFIEAEEHFVSNGGYKLSRALKKFAYSCKEKTFVDIGASTGGFTDCLLQNGAKKVYAVDVGESLLDKSLLSSEKIVQMQNTNARYLTKSDFPEEIEGIVTDVSFISLRLIFPVICGSSGVRSGKSKVSNSRFFATRTYSSAAARVVIFLSFSARRAALARNFCTKCSWIKAPKLDIFQFPQISISIPSVPRITG